MFYYCIVFAIVIQSNFVVVPSPKSMVWLGHLSQIIEWLGHLIVPNKSIFFFFFGGGGASLPLHTNINHVDGSHDFLERERCLKGISILF